MTSPHLTTVPHVEDLAMGPEEAAAAFVEDLANQRIRSGTWLNNQVFDPLQWSVPNILPEGYAMLVAPPKAGKSWLVAGVGLACAAGGYALGGIRVEARPVLYFALEDGDRRLQDRFRKLEGCNFIPRAMHRILEVRDLNELVILAEHFQDLCLQDKTLPPLIIVDTLGKVNPGRKGNESQYDAEYGVGSRLQNLAKRVPGTTVLAVHHTNKGEHSDFLNSVSGTQGVTGACDAVLVLNRARKSDDAVLSITGRDIEHETEYAITSEAGKWVLKGGSLAEAEDAAQEVKADQVEAASRARYGDQTQAILRAVNDVGPGETITAKDVAEDLGIGNDMAGKYLRRLMKDGRIAKAGRGTYKPLSEVSEVSDSQVTGLKDSLFDSDNSDMSETDSPPISSLTSH
ncbi:hypothetical protein CATRI_00100 [Corynebacterium atrinae]|uniref:AAA family ATPase n=1 Tax=Corynebacterium atrinae TaxID=1336740 RepID=UPI0025B56E26|nr:AAA family ATPase [Corynebacterium atrinae]WJY62143.1 hypothetical protein CATRI_00100 [Corynebacterium atrinae]